MNDLHIVEGVMVEVNGHGGKYDFVAVPADSRTKTRYIQPLPKFEPASMTEDITIRRKRLIHRSRYTGMKETDLLLGGFANKYVSEFSSEELDLYESLLAAGDPNIYVWAVGREEVPAEYDTSVMALLKEFSQYDHRASM
jgi:succinate dehydrogenase flavin-adding protein (antitoxin of CptAB toxin-antitoxin module)